MAVFDKHMPKANQIDFVDEFAMPVTTRDLLTAPQGDITDAGVADNIDVAIRYVAAWLGGRGAVPIRNLMEDAATAEIARAQLWQWRRFDKSTAEGTALTADMLGAKIEAICKSIQAEVEGQTELQDRIAQASTILKDLVLADEFVEFLTLPAYDVLTEGLKKSMRLKEFED